MLDCNENQMGVQEKLTRNSPCHLKCQFLVNHGIKRSFDEMKYAHFNQAQASKDVLLS